MKTTEQMKKMAVIIKHPYRDFDFRVDIYEVTQETTNEELYNYAMSQMMGPFEIIAITDKLSLNCKIISNL
jgi:hypothetical protein